MKFTRFEAASSPGTARSGIAYEGRFYETDGTNAIAIHEASDIRLLAPLGRPTSVRIYRPNELVFDYANPAGLLDPHARVTKPAYAERLGYTPCLALIVGGAGINVETDQADETLLGLALGHVFTTLRDHGGRSSDVGYVVGPAILTPDEIAESSIQSERGAQYNDTLTLKINGLQVEDYEVGALPFTPAQVLSHASESTSLREGDLVLVPLTGNPRLLEVADEISLSGPKLGALLARII